MDKENVYVVSMPDDVKGVLNEEDIPDSYIKIPKDEIDSPKYRDLGYYARPVEIKDKGTVYLVKAVPIVNDEQWLKKNIRDYDPRSNETGYHVIPDSKMSNIQEKILRRENPRIITDVREQLENDQNTALVYFSSGTEHIYEKQELLNFDDYVVEMLRENKHEKTESPEYLEGAALSQEPHNNGYLSRSYLYHTDKDKPHTNSNETPEADENKKFQDAAQKAIELMTWETLRRVLKENEEREELLEKSKKKREEELNRHYEGSNESKRKEEDELMPYFRCYY